MKTRMLMAFATMLVMVNACFAEVTWTHFKGAKNIDGLTVFKVDLGRPLERLETVEVTQGPHKFPLNMKTAPYSGAGTSRTVFCVELWLCWFDQQSTSYTCFEPEDFSFKIIPISEEQKIPPSAWKDNPHPIEIEWLNLFNGQSVESEKSVIGIHFSKWFMPGDCLQVSSPQLGGYAEIPPTSEYFFSGLDYGYLVVSTNSNLSEMRKLRFRVVSGEVSNPPVVIGNKPKLKGTFRSTERIAYRMTATTNPIAVTIGSGRRKQSYLVPDSEIFRKGSEFIVVLDKTLAKGPVRFGLATSTTTNVIVSSPRPESETFSSSAGYLNFARGLPRSVAFSPTVVTGACIPAQNVFYSENSHAVWSKKPISISGLY